MKTRRWWGLLALLAVLAAAAVWLLRRDGDQAARYRTAPVERGSIEQTVSAIGAVQPLAYVDVGTQVTGQLKTLHVVVGQTVTVGQLVAEIDPELLAARVDATRATLQSQLAQLADRLAQQQLADKQLARNRQLIADGAVSQEVLDQSAAAVVQASAQVGSFKALVEQTQSVLRSDETNLRYTRIYSPLAGTVVSITARQGQTLVAAQQAPVILRVADLSTMTVWAQVSEADVAKLQVGMPVYFNTLGSERRWQSTVRQILPTPEVVNNVILYNVLFDVANPDGVLKPQMSAQVYAVLARADDVLLVPSAALQKIGGNAVPPRYRVQVLHESGTVEERAVEVGLLTRLQAEIKSGLRVGEAVVVGLAEPPARAGRRGRRRRGAGAGRWTANRR